MKIDWKKAIGLTAAVAMLVPLAACGGSSDGDGKSGASGTEDITQSTTSLGRTTSSPKVTLPSRSAPIRPPRPMSICSLPISWAF